VQVRSRVGRAVMGGIAHSPWEDVGGLFTRSARAGTAGLSGVFRWLADRHRNTRFTVERVPFSELGQWGFEAGTGNLVHSSGRFFSVEGVRHRDGNGPERFQPIIDQSEVGILVILVKEFDGVPYCLMQAKFEPGNVNTRQISPTVQATRSNFTAVHNGNPTPYVEYFRGTGRGRFLVDTLQSEQGSWFWHKRNRNIVVAVDEEVPLHEDFYWMSLHELRLLLREDNLVNMDTRTVMATMPMDPASAPEAVSDSSLVRSYRALSPESEPPALYSPAAIRSWLSRTRSMCEWRSRLIPLSEVRGWSRSPDEIFDDQAQDFRVIGVRVRAEGREVAEWRQPLLGTRGHGLSVFVAKPIDGVLHLLVRARPEPGLMGSVEMGPTVQVAPKADLEAELRGVPFAEHALTQDPRRVRYDTVLSEEGGRFHHAQNRYRVVLAGEELPVEVPDDYCWVTVGQLTRFLRHSHYLNIEARSLLACLHSLW